MNFQKIKERFRTKPMLLWGVAAIVVIAILMEIIK